MLQRHDLAAEKDLAHRLRPPVIQPVEGADKAEGGNRPDHGGNFPVAQPVQQVLGPGKKRLGDNGQGSAGFQGGINVFDGYVKIKGRLVSDNIIVINVKDVGEIIDKIND